MSRQDDERETAGATTGDAANGMADAHSAQASDATTFEIDKLNNQLAKKNEELAELKDRYLRALADSENTRKRLRQQSEETIRVQKEGVLREMLPIIDNLERAVEASKGGGNGKSIVEGVEMVLRSMLDFLKAHGVSPIITVGHPFDPEKHEAIEHVESNDHPPNTVVDEYHRGYVIGERMLRPARVAVAKERSSSSEGGTNGGSGPAQS